MYIKIKLSINVYFVVYLYSNGVVSDVIADAGFVLAINSAKPLKVPPHLAKGRTTYDK